MYKNPGANHRNPKKNTTFAFNKRSVTPMWKCSIIQHTAYDSGYFINGLKKSCTTRICKGDERQYLHLPYILRTCHGRGYTD